MALQALDTGAEHYKDATVVVLGGPARKSAIGVKGVKALLLERQGPATVASPN